jgi:hypothetical protein
MGKPVLLKRPLEQRKMGKVGNVWIGGKWNQWISKTLKWAVCMLTVVNFRKSVGENTSQRTCSYLERKDLTDLFRSVPPASQSVYKEVLTTSSARDIYPDTAKDRLDNEENVFRNCNIQICVCITKTLYRGQEKLSCSSVIWVWCTGFVTWLYVNTCYVNNLW